MIESGRFSSRAVASLQSRPCPLSFCRARGVTGSVTTRRCCPDFKSGADIFDMRGVDRERGCMVVVRPDQYVAHVLPLDPMPSRIFFDGFMLRPCPPERHQPYTSPSFPSLPPLSSFLYPPSHPSPPSSPLHHPSSSLLFHLPRPAHDERAQAALRLRGMSSGSEGALKGASNDASRARGRLCKLVLPCPPLHIYEHPSIRRPPHQPHSLPTNTNPTPTPSSSPPHPPTPLRPLEHLSRPFAFRQRAPKDEDIERSGGRPGGGPLQSD